MVIRENYLNTLIDAKDTEFIKVITRQPFRYVYQT